jgi:hypothetical protein
MWQKLSGFSSALDSIEKKVRNTQRRPQPSGRETPFWATKRFVFDRGDFSPASSPLVHDAGRVTRVNRLTYNAFVVTEGRAGTPPNQTPSGTFARQVMRPTSRGLTAALPAFSYYDDNIPNTRRQMGAAVHHFDFEWGLQLGSSQRQYAQRRDNAGQAGVGHGGPVFMSRNSLGNPENDKQLLFTERHPLVLKTNEFMTFTVRPTASYLAMPGNSSFTAVQPETFEGRFVVEISYAGYRTFGYE